MYTDYIKELEEFEDLVELNNTMIRINKISESLTGKEKKLFDFICGSVSNVCLLTRDHKEELEQCLSKIEESLNIKEYEEEPEETTMVLSLFSRLRRERGIALSQALSSEINAYREGLQRAREERYASIIEESAPVDSPITRRLG